MGGIISITRGCCLMRTGADSGSAGVGGKYMKKSISVVTLFPGASQCYAGQIRELFGDLVEV